MHRRDSRYANKKSFGYGLENHLRRTNAYAYFLLFWDGDRLPALKSDILFTDRVTLEDMVQLTGERLGELVRSTFLATSAAPYKFIDLCGSTGEPTIPGLQHLSDCTSVGEYGGGKIQDEVGRFKRE